MVDTDVEEVDLCDSECVLALVLDVLDLDVLDVDEPVEPLDEGPVDDEPRVVDAFELDGLDAAVEPDVADD